MSVPWVNIEPFSYQHTAIQRLQSAWAQCAWHDTYECVTDWQDTLGMMMLSASEKIWMLTWMRMTGLWLCFAHWKGSCSNFLFLNPRSSWANDQHTSYVTSWWPAHVLCHELKGRHSFVLAGTIAWCSVLDCSKWRCSCIDWSHSTPRALHYAQKLHKVAIGCLVRRRLAFRQPGALLSKHINTPCSLWQPWICIFNNVSGHAYAINIHVSDWYLERIFTRTKFNPHSWVERNVLELFLFMQLTKHLWMRAVCALHDTYKPS